MELESVVTAIPAVDVVLVDKAISVTITPIVSCETLKTNKSPAVFTFNPVGLEIEDWIARFWFPSSEHVFRFIVGLVIVIDARAI